jgi:hypothetical protein
MLKNFPETPDLVRGLEKEGLHVLTNLEKIAKIAQQHGVAVTRDMIKRALKNGTPDANSITFLVETARRVS